MTATLEAPSPALDPPAARRSRRWTRGGWAATALVGLIAGLLRVVRLDLPAGRIFDEVYYSCDAQGLLQAGVELAKTEDPGCTLTDQGSYVVHPPLGKWAIALGLRVFGLDEVGWRSAAAVAGTLTVVVLVRAGRRLTGSTLLGCLAGLLLAVDGLHFVQSRIAMLDVFLVLWTTSAFACLLADRDAVRSRLAAGQRLGLRPWRLAAGLCLGAGLATKWSAAYYALALVALSLVWEASARRRHGTDRSRRRTLRANVLPGGLALGLLPLTVYVASWAGWFASDQGYSRDWAQGRSTTWFLVPDAVRSLWHYHAMMLDFHSGLSTPHPYESRPVSWLLLVRPVLYYYPPGITGQQGQYGCQAEQCVREVLAVGNPVVWWGGFLALVGLLWLWLAKRDWRASTVLVLVAAGVLPWLRDDLTADRTMFLFYALPALPFLCLGLALVAGWALGGPTAPLLRRRWGALGVGAFVALALVVFGFFYPVLAAQVLPLESWQSRVWLDSWV